MRFGLIQVAPRPFKLFGTLPNLQTGLSLQSAALRPACSAGYVLITPGGWSTPDAF